MLVSDCDCRQGTAGTGYEREGRKQGHAGQRQLLPGPGHAQDGGRVYHDVLGLTTK